MSKNSSSDLKHFLENEYDAWSRNLEDIEQKFLSYEQVTSLSTGPQPLEKTRKRKATPTNDHIKEDNQEWTFN